MTREPRLSNGQFGPGNPGGPGRPRRAVEADYLKALGETVPLDAWQRIVASAVAAAEQGDHQARAWLAKYLLGTNPAPQPLTEIAADESDGLGTDEAIAQLTRKRRSDRESELDFDDIFNADSAD